MTVPYTTFADKTDFVEQISAAIRRVAPKFGLPARPTDFFVTAHAAISTGWGKKGVQGYNLTGMKAGSSWTGPTFQTRAFECVPIGTPNAYDDPNCVGTQRQDITATWKQFDSFDGWATEYFNTLLRPGYADSLAKLQTSSTDYMAQLGKDGWYTAAVSTVSDMWKSILGTMSRMTIRDLNTGETIEGRSDIGRVIAVTLGFLAVGAATTLILVKRQPAVA
jgi:hypothetical protein